MNVHQFFRLTGGWWDHGFKIMVGIRAGRIFKKVMGKSAPRSPLESRPPQRTAIDTFIIWEEALVETKNFIAEGGNLDDYRKEPYAKVPPTESEVAQRMNHKRPPSSPQEALRWVKVPLNNEEDR